MAILKMTIEVEITGFIDYEDEDEIIWAESEILQGYSGLILHSNEIDDEVGEVIKVSDITWILGE